MVLVIALLAVALVACGGVPKEKIDLAKGNYARVDAPATRMEEIKAIADSSTMPIFSADFEFGEAYDERNEMREIYAMEIQDIDKKSKKSRRSERRVAERDRRRRTGC